MNSRYDGVCSQIEILGKAVNHFKGEYDVAVAAVEAAKIEYEHKVDQFNEALDALRKRFLVR